ILFAVVSHNPVFPRSYPPYPPSFPRGLIPPSPSSSPYFLFEKAVLYFIETQDALMAQPAPEGVPIWENSF
ncbi:MAG: hypothetical protein LUE31_08050, partial [Lachnospiraceae bacterium]|nr:hypothetical protein [Lachnospiraceae bacterium]